MKVSVGTRKEQGAFIMCWEISVRCHEIKQFAQNNLWPLTFYGTDCIFTKQLRPWTNRTVPHICRPWDKIHISDALLFQQISLKCLFVPHGSLNRKFNILVCVFLLSFNVNTFYCN